MHPDSGVEGVTHWAAAVEGDDVARVWVRPAYRVVMTVNCDAARDVAKRLCACDIGSDDVTLNEIAGGVLSEGHTRVAIVARNQIAGRRAGSSCQAADLGPRDASIETQAKIGITEGDCARDISANEVALHRVVRSGPQIDAAVVSGNDIAGINVRATDEII